MKNLFFLLFFAAFCFAACDDPWSIQLDSSNTNVENNFDASVTGSAGSYSISISSNAGTVSQGSRSTRVVVNWQIPWGSDVTLYAFIGADDVGVMMGWAYCHGNKLTDVWLEDTTGLSGFTNPRVTGTCNIKSTPKAVQLRTQERCYPINHPSSWPSMSGTGLSLESGKPGTVTMAGSQYSLLPFAVVHCNECHSALLDGGWIETHAIMRSSNNVCLGIFYMQIKPKNEIPLNYVNCFFQEVDDTAFQAKYEIGAMESMNPTLTTRSVSASVVLSTAAGTSTAIIASGNGSSLGTSSTTTASASVASASATSTSSTINSSTSPATTSTTSIFRDPIGPPVTVQLSTVVSGSSTTVLQIPTGTGSDAASATGRAGTTAASNSAAAGHGQGMMTRGSMLMTTAFLGVWMLYLCI